MNPWKIIKFIVGWGILLLFVLIVAVMADAGGHKGFANTIVLAFLISFTVSTLRAMWRKSEIDCPYCSEKISAKAKKCKHCGEFINEAVSPLRGGDDVSQNKQAPPVVDMK